MAETLFPLFLFAITMFYTPGPNNVMLTASAATYGFRRTIPHMLGVAVGFPAMFLAVGLGFGAIFSAVPWIRPVMTVCGAAYLLYLAWRIANAAPPQGKGDGAKKTTSRKGRSRPMTFLEAAAFQWANPKAWVMILGALAAFTSGGTGGAPTVEILGIFVLFVAIGLTSTSTWAGFGVAIGRLLARSEGARRLFNWAMAGLLVLSLVPVLRDLGS
ncbi:MAG: LysE family translocator [Rhodospirillum sp.]|nr:LysE family translocator [Rhodospirillum sp.]MCF8487572.1 LysE family translocator [Rhodospirillum sp.]MCF8499055.1 LysE family translocator [Rhodospirillum sp.]